MSHVEHKAQAPVSVAGHLVTGHAIVKDEPAQVTAQVRAQLADPRTQIIVTTGGTGISSRHGTFEAIDGLLEKRLDGFGELCRGNGRGGRITDLPKTGLIVPHR